MGRGEEREYILFGQDCSIPFTRPYPRKFPLPYNYIIKLWISLWINPLMKVEPTMSNHLSDERSQLGAKPFRHQSFRGHFHPHRNWVLYNLKSLLLFSPAFPPRVLMYPLAALEITLLLKANGSGCRCNILTVSGDNLWGLILRLQRNRFWGKGFPELP